MAHTQIGRPTYEAHTREYTHKHTHTQTNTQRGPTADKASILSYRYRWVHVASYDMTCI